LAIVPGGLPSFLAAIPFFTKCIIKAPVISD
jgi:hypothetical protein